MAMSLCIFSAGGSTAQLHVMGTGERCWVPEVLPLRSTDPLSLAKGREKCHGACQEHPSCQQRPQHVSCCAWLAHAVTGMSSFISCHRSQRQGGAGSTASMGSKAITWLSVLKASRKKQGAWSYSTQRCLQWRFLIANLTQGMYFIRLTKIKVFFGFPNFHWPLFKIRIYRESKAYFQPKPITTLSSLRKRGKMKTTQWNQEIHLRLIN